MRSPFFRWALLGTLLCRGDGAFFESVHSHRRDVGGRGAVAQINIAHELGLQEGVSFVPVKNSKTAAGKIKTKLQQRFHDVPLYGTQLVAEKAEDGWYSGSWMGSIVKNIELKDLRPAYTKSQAVHILKKANGHATSFWESAIHNEDAKLYLVVDDGNRTHLAFRATYFLEPVYRDGGDEMSAPSRPVGFIDAHTGTIVDKWDDQPMFWKPKPKPQPSIWQSATISGVGGNVGVLGKQLYNDLNVSTTKDTTICTYNTSIVQVQNLAGATRGSFVPAIFECGRAELENYDLVNGGYSPLNDAARNTEITVRMYRAYTGHDGPQDSLPLKARVHYGRQYENAYWDGTQMTIGDGGRMFYPLTTLDIVAHEYGHAFTTSNSNLEYRRMPGGINEAFSDMSGEAAKYFSNGTNDFVIGGYAMKNGQGLRYMCNPPEDGRSIGNATQYNDSLDVHYSSGVYNKAFCLLSQTGNWTTELSFRVFARANDLYWGPKTDFSWGACGVKEAASDLGFDVDDVINAFAKVEVACKLCKSNTKC